MTDENIQREPPSPPTGEPRSALETYRDQQASSSTTNPMARIAFWLGILSLISLGTCVIIPFMPWKFPEPTPAERRWGMDPNRPTPVPILLCMACVVLELALGPAALIFGVLGARVSKQNPTVGGLGHARFGIVIGLLISLLYWIPFVLFAMNGFRITGVPVMGI